MSALTQLEAININVHNRILAVQDAGALEWEPQAYRATIASLADTDVEDVNISDDAARLAFMYLVQDVVEGQRSDALDIASAEAKAEAYISSHPWVLAKPEYEYEPTSKVDALGAPKQKKGAKKQAAITFWNANQDNYTTRKEWIEALCEAVGLTPAAASTYHYNLKKGIWS